ncbi:MAG: hypothetical protein IAE89_07990 [Anaerolineae bacterium]|nr:hypothetical protein [Anaerolineae bacterium]
MQSLNRLPLGQRRFVFLMIFIGGLLIIGAIALALVAGSLNSGRSLPVALVPEVRVGVLAELPDPDSFPAAVAVADDGIVYTGSFASGAVWVIQPNGNTAEISGARALIGSVSALEPLNDDTLLIVDAGDTDPRTSGGGLWRLTLAGDLTNAGEPTDGEGFIAPNDITLDTRGNFYVSDSGRNQILRFRLPESDTIPSGEVWWSPPSPPEGTSSAIVGLAYDALNDAIIATDPETNTIYRISVEDGSTTVIFQYPESGITPPGFDGAVVLPDGTLYVAALGQNGIARVDIENNALDYIAGLFRGSSDVDYDAASNRLIVPNFDQSGLVLPLTSPSLPFTIDYVAFN